MKLRALRLYNVRCFAERGIALENMTDGVNVLCAANESGKSTSFEALHALFFSAHSSTNRQVKSLRPYSDGNPLIEADIVTPQGQFRLTKQFLSKAFARVQDLQRQTLLAQADEAENFITNLIKTGHGNPAGLLWVRQGVNTLEKQSGAQEAAEIKSRIGLLQSVQGEVDNITGGRRMDAIIDTLRAELDGLITKKGAAKTGSRYHQAIEAVKRLTLEEQELNIKVTALRQALDERARLQKRLAECDDAKKLSAEQREINIAQAEFDRAKLHHEQCNTAAAQLELARQTHGKARQMLENFQPACAQLAIVQQQIQQAQTKREHLAASRHQQRQEFDLALKTHAQYENQLQQFRQQLARAESYRQHATLAKNYAQACQIMEELQQAQAARARIHITPKIYEQLQKIDIEVARFQASATLARPSFKVHYNEHAKTAIKFDGADLIEAQEHFYVSSAQLEIPDLGTITLQANLDSDAEKNLSQAQNRYRQMLNQYYVADLTAARQQMSQAQQCDNQIAQLRLALDQIAPQGLEALQTQLSQLEAVLEEAAAPHPDPVQMNEQISLLEQRKQTLAALMQTSQAQIQAHEQDFIDNEGQLATLEAERAQLQTIIGAPENGDARQQDLSQQSQISAAALQVARRRFEILQQNAPDFEAAKARLQRLQSAFQATAQEINRLRESLAGLNAAIATHADEAVEEKWFEVREALGRARTQLEAQETNLAILQRLDKALTSAREQARDLYLTPIMQELTPLFKLVFDDLVLHLDDKSLLPQRISRRGQEEDMEHLSGGLVEQISILTRLAFARLLARSGQEVPVILDDALHFCDDERIEKMFDVLHAQAPQQQILVFSCRSRAFQRLGGTSLYMQDWQP